MPYKTCPYCGTVSYSAAKLNPDLCPRCGRDITNVPSYTRLPEEKGKK